MKGHGAKFGRKKGEAIASLIANRNLEEAAKAAGIAPATLKRWMKMPEFKNAYLKARRDIVFQTNARLQQHSGVSRNGRHRTTYRRVGGGRTGEARRIGAHSRIQCAVP